METKFRSGRHTWPSYFWAAACVAALTVAVHVAAQGAVLREAAWTVLVGGAAAMVLAGVRRHRPERDGPWRLLAFAMGLLVVDNLVLFPLWGPSAVRDVVSNVAQLLAFCCLGLVALGLGHRQVPNGDREAAIDATTIMVALFSALSGFVFAPQATQPATLLGNAVFLVAPLLLAAVTAAGLRLLFVGGRGVASMWLLVASSLAALAGHVLRTLGQSSGTYARGEWQDLFVAGAYVTAGLAALHPSMTAMTKPATAQYSERGLTLGRLIILGISLMTPPVTMLLQPAGTSRVMPLVASIAASVLVMWRLWRLVSERERVRDAMRRLAIHDSLTGLPNRAALMEGLNAALARGSRTGSPTAVIFIDLDGFKSVNDTGGHAAGDEVLIVTADRLRASERTGDLLARLSGDEFVMVCDNATEAAAVVIAERMLAALDGLVLVEGVTYSLTASIGVATTTSVPADADLLVSAADQAMYEAKRDGGSRVRSYRAMSARPPIEPGLEPDLVP